MKREVFSIVVGPDLPQHYEALTAWRVGKMSWCIYDRETLVLSPVNKGDITLRIGKY